MASCWSLTVIEDFARPEWAECHERLAENVARVLSWFGGLFRNRSKAPSDDQGGARSLPVSQGADGRAGASADDDIRRHPELLVHEMELR
jgi:hypothetical protein